MVAATTAAEANQSSPLSPSPFLPLATCRTRRPLCTDEIFNLARAAPNVCVLNLHGNLSILTENGQCKCLPGQMNGRERSRRCCCCTQCAFPPCTGYCSQLVSQRPAGIAPWHSVRIVDVSLGIFNTRLHLRLPNVISGTTVACATVTCPQARPPLSLSPSLPSPSLPFFAPFCSVNRSSFSSAMDPSGPMGDCCYR